MTKGPRLSVIGLHEQRASFYLRWPCWRTYFASRPWAKAKRVLIAVGPLQPFEHGTEYVTRIEYDGVLAPRVWIDSPQLVRRADDERIPHMYGQERVCAFLPEVDWRRDMAVALYVPGRVAQWLYFYEFWHATGEWYGGGIHPQVNEKVRRLSTRIDTEVPID